MEDSPCCGVPHLVPAELDLALNKFCQYIHLWMYGIPAADLHLVGVGEGHRADLAVRVDPEDLPDEAGRHRAGL